MRTTATKSPKAGDSHSESDDGSVGLGAPLLAGLVMTGSTSSDDEFAHVEYHTPYGDFEMLPDAVILHIVEFMSAKQIGSCILINRKFNLLLEDDVLWKRLKKRDFGADCRTDSFDEEFQEAPSILSPKEEYVVLLQGRLQVREHKILTRKLRDSALLCRYLQVFACFSFPIFVLTSLILILAWGISGICFVPVALSALGLLCFYIWACVIWIKGQCVPYFHWRMFRIMSIPNVVVPSITACVSRTGRPGKFTSGMFMFLSIVSFVVASSVLMFLKFLGMVPLPYCFTLLPMFFSLVSFVSLPFTSCTMHSVRSFKSVLIFTLTISGPPLMSTLLLFLRLDGVITITHKLIFLPMICQIVLMFLSCLITCRSCKAPVITFLFAPWILLIVFLCVKNWDNMNEVRGENLLAFFIPALFGVGSLASIGAFVIVAAALRYSKAKAIARKRDELDPINSLP